MMYYLVSAENVSNKRKIDIPCEIVKKRKVSDSPSGKRKKVKKVAKKLTSTPINKEKKESNVNANNKPWTSSLQAGHRIPVILCQILRMPST